MEGGEKGALMNTEMPVCTRNKREDIECGQSRVHLNEYARNDTTGLGMARMNGTYGRLIL